MKNLTEDQSLIEIIEKININLKELCCEGTSMALTDDEKKFGKISRTEKILDNNFFNIVSITNWNDKQRLSLIKRNTRKENYIDFINKVSKVFGEDHLNRREFNEFDSKKLKGEYHDFKEKYRTELRGWDYVSPDIPENYYIQISFSEDIEQNLIFNIV